MVLLVDSLFDTGVRYCNIQGEGERDTADRGDTILKKGGKMGGGGWGGVPGTNVSVLFKLRNEEIQYKLVTLHSACWRGF